MGTIEAPPPPLIAKVGRYTVFITPPATPRPTETSRFQNPNPRPKFIPNEKLRSNLSPNVVKQSPPPPPPPPPVQVPPPQFEKGKGGKKSEGSVFGFFWYAVAKVQDAHSSLDQYLADWLGLDQSRYQWALDDYYQNNGAGKDGGKPKELAGRGQAL